MFKWLKEQFVKGFEITVALFIFGIVVRLTLIALISIILLIQKMI